MGQKHKTLEDLARAKAWGAKLRAARLRAGLSGEQLGDAVGRRRSVISAWENGKNMPSPTLIPDIAKALDMKPDELAVDVNITRLHKRNTLDRLSLIIGKRLGIELLRALDKIPDRRLRMAARAWLKEAIGADLATAEDDG